MSKSKFEEIYRDLKYHVEQGDYLYSELLPSENNLIGIYDCSRNTIRRAIAGLVGDGYVQAVREEWKSRGISFRENERIRLITVFFHDKPTEEESILFVGHVGVLLTADDGTLYFVEKVAFQEPYRMLRFADRTALSDYLMGKYDVSWGQSTARPFIMENDELMEGWRPNPDSADAAYH